MEGFRREREDGVEELEGRKISRGRRYRAAVVSFSGKRARVIACIRMEEME